MKPINECVAELRLAVLYIERNELPPGASFYDRMDLHTLALTTLLEALDSIDPGLGTRLMSVLYPRSDALVLGGDLGHVEQCPAPPPLPWLPDHCAPGAGL